MECQEDNRKTSGRHGMLGKELLHLECQHLQDMCHVIGMLGKEPLHPECQQEEN